MFVVFPRGNPSSVVFVCRGFWKLRLPRCEISALEGVPVWWAGVSPTSEFGFGVVSLPREREEPVTGVPYGGVVMVSWFGEMFYTSVCAVGSESLPAFENVLTRGFDGGVLFFLVWWPNLSVRPW